MLIIIIVLVVVLIASAAGFAYFFLTSKNKEEENKIGEAAPMVKLKESEISDLNWADPIRTNLLTSADGSEHVISLNISVGVNNTDKKGSPEIVSLLTQKEPIARSVALNVVRKKTYQELKRPDGQEILESDIATSLQEEFDSNLIVRVKISDMILQ